MRFIALPIALCTVFCHAVADDVGGPLMFSGSADASAAVALDGEHFIVADDENNVLRIYRVGTSQPVSTRDISDMLDLAPKHPEADVEGCTRVGDRIYWITSHGRNKNGKARPNRYRFFATTVPRPDDISTLKLIGRPCRTLARALATAPTLAPLDLGTAMHLDGPEPPKTLRDLLAPKAQGLNIEALAASADGQTLYIGLRNPRPAGTAATPMAAIVPLINADEVITHEQEPQFGEPLLWDLQGLGLRALEYSPTSNRYYAVAGPHTGDRGSILLSWSGTRGDPPRTLQVFERHSTGLALESIAVFPGTRRILLISDDGAVPVAVTGPADCLEQLNRDRTCDSKHLADAERRMFRAVWYDPDAVSP